jgi:hypothetical protein
MKLLFVGMARSIWQFETNMLNPKGLAFQPVIEKLMEKYKFASAPKNALDFDEQKTLTFKAGTFVNSKGTAVAVGFTIYSDGFVGDTFSNTSDSDDFLTEIMNWLIKDFGFAVPPNIGKGYLSQMDIECETPLVQLNPKLENLLKYIESRVRSVDGKPREYDVGGLSFWTEDVTKPLAPAIIKFERKYHASFSANHYFSQAPMRTEEHLAFLNELELLLKN